MNRLVEVSVTSEHPVNILPAFLALITVYVVHSIFVILNAVRKSSGADSLWRQLFAELDQSTEAWITFGMALLLPVALSWLTAWAHDPEQVGPFPLLYFGALAGLTVLIAIELSLLNDIRNKSVEPWKGLLYFAVALDFISLIFLIFLTAFLNRVATVGVKEIQTEVAVAFLYSWSFLSHSLVILLTRRASGHDGSQKETT